MTNQYVPTDDDRRQVAEMARIGTPQEGIAKVLAIDPKTLRKNFREELDTAAEIANAKVGGSLYDMAMKGNVAAAIWWTKARMRWSETQKHEVAVDGGLTDVETAQRVAAILAGGQIELEHTEVPEMQETASES